MIFQVLIVYSKYNFGVINNIVKYPVLPSGFKHMIW
jgi:hypothetical protein